MIEYLNHRLIYFIHKSTDSYIIKSPEHSDYEYYLYKCIKCNNLIFYTLKNQKYWMYENGKFKMPRIGTYKDWHFLNLTCEEEQIRKLVE